MDVVREFYPLYLHDFPEHEQDHLVALLRTGRELRVCTLSELERFVGAPLHGVFDKTRAKTGAERAPIAHRKWVKLYDYAMRRLPLRISEALATVTDERRALEEASAVRHRDPSASRMEVFQKRIESLSALRDDLDALIATGKASGRYGADMHMFNLEHMFLDSRSAGITDEFSTDPYICFRYRSDSAKVVVALIVIREAEGRPVFVCKVLNDEHARETRGLVYQLGDRLYLFGFLDGDHGAEFLALKAVDKDHAEVNGLIATVNKDGQPHTKQCVLVQLGKLVGTDRINRSKLPDDSKELDALKACVDEFFWDPDPENNPDKQIALQSGKFIALADYVEKASIYPINLRGVPKRPAGPPG